MVMSICVLPSDFREQHGHAEQRRPVVVAAVVVDELRVRLDFEIQRLVRIVDAVRPVHRVSPVPPGRRSLLCVVSVKPRGPHHCATCSGSVQASHTASTGASYIRMIRISFDLFLATIFLPFRSGFCGSFLFRRDSFQIRIQPIEALLPKRAILLHPVGRRP